MEKFPHRYVVSAVADEDGDVSLESERLVKLPSASPAQFGGPGDRWSPETLLVASVADCFILTFRAIARASSLQWISFDCGVEGTLDRVDGVTQFTSFDVRATVRVPEGTDVDKARRLMEKTERACLITNSLKGESRLTAEILVSSDSH